MVVSLEQFSSEGLPGRRGVKFPTSQTVAALCRAEHFLAKTREPGRVDYSKLWNLQRSYKHTIATPLHRFYLHETRCPGILRFSQPLGCQSRACTHNLRGRCENVFWRADSDDHSPERRCAQATLGRETASLIRGQGRTHRKARDRYSRTSTHV